jgi:hypothetical protein
MMAEIRNVVVALPGGGGSYEADARPLASFYADLLGLRFLREDWFILGRHDQSGPYLAFGDGPAVYVMPRWPDPEYPQQLHLDFPAADLDAADRLAISLGAVRLQDRDVFRSYADPVGHPFCLYRDGAAPVDPERPLPGQIGRVVVDCVSPRALAGFYAELLGMRGRVLDTPERVEIASADRSPALAFQHAQATAPRWPDPAYPQQMHLDLAVDDADAATQLVLSLGASRLPDMGGSCPVYADPAGHPFCLCGAGQ